MIAHEIQEQLKLRTVDRLGYVGPTHVIDDDRGRQAREEIPELGQINRFEIDHDVPAEPGNPRGDFVQLVLWREIDQALDEVEANTSDPGCMHVLEFGISNATPDSRNTAGRASGIGERTEHRAVVSAVAGCLHDYIACKAQMVAQRIELLPRRIARRVLSFRSVGVFGTRTEHVAVRINGVRGYPEARLGWVRVPIKPIWSLLEWAALGSGHQRFLL